MSTDAWTGRGVSRGAAVMNTGIAPMDQGNTMGGVKSDRQVWKLQTASPEPPRVRSPGKSAGSSNGCSVPVQRTCERYGT